jgi:hypothetical protein
MLVFKRRFQFVFILSMLILVIYWEILLRNHKYDERNYFNDSEESLYKSVICVVLTSENTIATKGVAVWETW